MFRLSEKFISTLRKIIDEVAFALAERGNSIDNVQ